MKDIKKKMKAIRSGHHACLFFDTLEEQAEASAAFLAIGLEQGERCLFLGSDPMVRGVKAQLEIQGVATGAAMSRGALIMTSARDYLENDVFVPARTIDFLSQALEEAIADGFTGLRGTGDMLWEMGHSGDLSSMMAYETALDHFFYGKKLTGLCQYHRLKTPAEFRIHAIHSHPVVVTEGTVCVPNRLYNLGAASA